MNLFAQSSGCAVSDCWFYHMILQGKTNLGYQQKKEHHITITKIVRWLRRRINSVIQVSHQNDWPKMKYAQWMIWRFMKYSIYQPKISDMECQQMKTGSNGMSLMPDTITEPKDGDMTDKTSDIGNYCVRSIHILYIYIYIYIIISIII